MLKPWDQLSADEKKLFIRQVEVFAAYAAYSDYEIGRVIQHFQDLGRLDNTLVIYINGDNGTSAEGGPLGTPNEVAFFNGLNERRTLKLDNAALPIGGGGRIDRSDLSHAGCVVLHTLTRPKLGRLRSVLDPN